MPATGPFVRLDRACGQFLSTIAMRPMRAAVLLAFITLGACLPGLTVLPAIDRTESAVALASRHIAESGDWLRPISGGTAQRKRPIGVFWAQALSLAANGNPDARHQITTFRWPSALATILAVLLMFALSRPLVGPAPALLASAAVAVTPVVVLHANLAIAEPLMLPLLVIAQVSLLAIYLEPARAQWRSGFWLGAFWLALGVSTWFNALAVPLLALVTVAGLAIADRSMAFMQRLQPVFGVLLLAVLSLPWLAAVWTIDGGTLYRGMGFRAILDVLEGGQDMKFKTVHGVFILTLLLGFVPIAHMLGPVAARAWSARHAPLIRFLLVWLIAPVVALELLSNKPPLYTVQAVMPAGALLVALAVAPGGSFALDVRAWPGLFTTTLLVVLGLAPALFGAILWVTQTPPSLALVFGYVAFAGLFGVAGWAAAKGHGRAWIVTALAGTWVFALWLNGLMMPALGNFCTAPQVQTLARRLDACDGTQLVTSGFREPSLTLAHGTSLPPAAAAARFAQGSAALVESRARAEFEAALPNATGAAQRPAPAGCIRALNLARGCALLFHLYQPAPQDRARPPANPNRCDPGLATDCRQRHDWLRARLPIPHCR